MPMLEADLPSRRATRRDFVRIAALTFGAGGFVMLAWPLIDQMNPSSDVIDYRVPLDLGTVPLGHQVVISSRRRPIIVRHRTAADIAAAVTDDTVALRDPERDGARVKPGHPEWLVIVGGCTREQCVVFPGPEGTRGWVGGWACPCCGSIYDTSGRARIGPAPRNLQVPSYEFLGKNKLRLA